MTFVNYLKGYNIAFKASAQKDMAKLAMCDKNAIGEKLALLVSGYQGLDIKKLVNYAQPTYRLRVGTYRIIYEVYQDKVIVLVIGIDHRKDAYK